MTFFIIFAATLVAFAIGYTYGSREQSKEVLQAREGELAAIEREMSVREEIIDLHNLRVSELKEFIEKMKELEARFTSLQTSYENEKLKWETQS